MTYDEAFCYSLDLARRRGIYATWAPIDGTDRWAVVFSETAANGVHYLAVTGDRRDLFTPGRNWFHLRGRR